MGIEAREIKIVPIESIKKNPKNRNKHPEDQIQRLADIIAENGFRTPLVVSNQSGLLVAGHGRLLAAIKAGLKEVPVIFQDFDSPEQEYQHGIADNAIQTWAEIDLAGINADLGDLGPDFNIDLLGLKDFILEPADKPPQIEDFEEASEKKMKFYTCPHCEKEFEEKQAMVRTIDG